MEKLSPVKQSFILHWGEMGTRWGVNRTVAQVHALLFLSPSPLNAEQIAETLGVARSNVSNSLKELQSWRIVKLVHVLGDRRAHYQSVKDVWEMFQIILEERKRRELDPTLTMLRECVGDLQKGGASDAYAREQMVAMLEFFETMVSCYQEIGHLPVKTLRNFVKLRGKVRKLLG